MSLGRFQECIEPARQSIRIGPRDIHLASYHVQIAACHFMRGEYSHAAERARDGVQANANLPLPRLILTASLARQGRIDEGRTVVAAFRQANPAYQAEFIAKVLNSSNPQFAEGRSRLQATLRELGLP
jgi:hypothetical protein